MNRNIFALGRAGDKKFMTSAGLENQKIGIIGLGRIGREIVKMIQPFRTGKISYYSKSRHEDSEKELGVEYAELENVLKESDVIFLCVSSDAGENFMGGKELANMKDGSLLVSFAHKGLIEESALLAELKKGRIRVASDYPMSDPDFNNLPLNNFYCFNGSNAFNTQASIKSISDMATESMINLLTTGEDKNKVN